MTQEKIWFAEAEKSLNIYSDYNCRFTIYKGFKLTEDNKGVYFIQDVRYRDFYSQVSEKDKEILTKQGFIKGADDICYGRAKKRRDRYEYLLSRYYQLIDELKKGDPKFNKKLANYKNNIEKFIDLYVHYDSKVSQHESKYNLNS